MSDVCSVYLQRIFNEKAERLQAVLAARYAVPPSATAGAAAANLGFTMPDAIRDRAMSTSVSSTGRNAMPSSLIACDYAEHVDLLVAVSAAIHAAADGSWRPYFHAGTGAWSSGTLLI